MTVVTNNYLTAARTPDGTLAIAYMPTVQEGLPFGKLGKAILKVKKAYLSHRNILQTVVGSQVCCLELK